uniref:Uncharacterized protein n=1 Tax=Arion vulgaris TaxID=1028688 RepID=A0A0B7BW88_9EUPU
MPIVIQCGKTWCGFRHKYCVMVRDVEILSFLLNNIGESKVDYLTYDLNVLSTLP